MSIVVLTPPEPLVSLALAKAQVRVDADDDSSDDLLNLAIRAASRELDGPDGWLQRAIGPQELELTLDGFAAWQPIRLLCPPVIAVRSVNYDDTAGAERTLDPTCFRLTSGGLLSPRQASWPIAAWGSVRISYRAGYAADDGQTPAIPEDIQHAVLLRVADLFANREAQTTFASGGVQPNPTVERLLATYRIWRA